MGIRDTVVPMSLVHRVRPSDVVPTGWTRLDENRFLVECRWPSDHEFFTPVRSVHDPLLFVEGVRQSTILIGHAELGIPLDHHFLMRGLHFTCLPEHFRVDGAAEVQFEVAVSDVKRRAGKVVALRSDVTVHRQGRLIGTGIGLTDLIPPKVYQRIRGERLNCRPTTPPPPPGVAPATVGRTHPDDVLLISSPQPGRWRLRVDTGHQTLFQRPNDHVPGMLLLEAARQAAHAVTSAETFFPIAGENTFHRYAELGVPTWIEARQEPVHGSGELKVVVSAHQEGEPVFVSELSARQQGHLR